MSAVIAAGGLVSARVSDIKPSTKAAMERWVRWRDGVGYGYGPAGPRGTGTCVLGKLLTYGRRRATCSKCHGVGFIRIEGQPRRVRCPKCTSLGVVYEDLDPIEHQYRQECPACFDEEARLSTGEIDGKTCFRCRGSGEIVRVERYVHPATIPSTRVYQRSETDWVASAINALVFSWAHDDATWWWHQVVLAEYDQDATFEPGEGLTRPRPGRTREQKACELGISPSFFSRCLKQALLAIQEHLEERFRGAY